MPFGKPPAIMSETRIILATQHEALMAAAKALPELAFHCADRRVGREAYELIDALRAAGIDPEMKT
jgi:hypothetical protein